MKYKLRVLLGALVVAIALIWALPHWAPAQAVHWVAPNNSGLTGVFAPNQSLSALSLIPVGAAPEQVIREDWVYPNDPRLAQITQ